MSPSPVDGTVVLDLTRPGAFKRLVARLLIQLMILTPLPAHVRVSAALFPVSMLWPLIAAEARKETGLYHAKARYLDPQLGRFLTQDSCLGQIDEPPSLHRYPYANDTPARYVDPTGHAAEESRTSVSPARLPEGHPLLLAPADAGRGPCRPRSPLRPSRGARGIPAALRAARAAARNRQG
jgi:RHS repeat-associated protein